MDKNYLSIRPLVLILFTFYSLNAYPQQAMNLEWEYYGPFNIAGRSNELLIDNNNSNHFFLASSVGGIYKSEDGGLEWNPLNTYDGHPIVSSITQANDANNTIFVGTGEFFYYGLFTSLNSGGNGNGVWRSTDGGDSWENLSQTSNYYQANSNIPIYINNLLSQISGVKSHPLNSNILFIGTNGGLHISENALDDAESVSFSAIQLSSGLSSGRVQSIDIALDGSVVFASISGRTFRSLDVQNNFKTGWELISDVGFGQHTTVRVAPSNSNIVYAVVNTSNDCMLGLYRSLDKGDTWQQVVSGGAPYTNDPFNLPTAPVGECDGIFSFHRQDLAIHPTNENLVVIGSSTLFKWNNSNETFSQIDLTESEVNSINDPKFLPLGKFNLKFDEQGNTLYISTTKGIFKSTSINEPNNNDIHFESINENLNNTLIYAFDAGMNGEVIAGTESTGSILMCTEELPLPINGEVLKDGTGGYPHISQFDSDFLFFNESFGKLYRSVDKGATFEEFLDVNIGKGCGQITCSLDQFGNCNANGNAGYVPVTHLMETSNKSIQQPTAYLYSPTDTFLPGQQLAQSKNAPKKFEVTLNNTLLPGDTAFFDDPYDAKYFVSSSACGIWMCNNPFESNPTFYRLTGGFNALSYDQSADGNHLYAVSGSNVLIISGFNELELNGNGSTAPIINQTGVSLTQSNIDLTNHLSLEGIAVDKNDPNHLLVVSIGVGNNNKIFRITDALSTNPIIEEVQGDLPKSIPLYDCIIDVQNSDNYIVASDFGIWASSDAGETWHQENTGLGNAFQVYQLKQKKLFEDDCPVLYAGIHGRGIARSLSLTPTFCDTEPACIEYLLQMPVEDLFEDVFLIYPNPTNNELNLYFLENPEGSFTANLYNFSGNLVHTKNFTENENKVIDVAFLPSGIYSVVIINSNTSYPTKTFIKE